MIGIDDYGFGQKNTWRKMVHKEIALRVPNKKKARVVYLAGEQDLDRKLFTQKGFNPNNLIIVEGKKQRAEGLRQQNKTVINDHLVYVVDGWPQNSGVEVVFADLCCGFEPNVSTMAMSMWNPKHAFTNSTAIFNLQRGRDHRTKPLGQLTRVILESLDSIGKLSSYPVRVVGSGTSVVTSDHRGAQMIFTQVVRMLSRMKFKDRLVPTIDPVTGTRRLARSGPEGMETESDKWGVSSGGRIIVPPASTEEGELFFAAVDMAMKTIDPVFLTYKNEKNIVFDAVIFDGTERALQRSREKGMLVNRFEHKPYWGEKKHRQYEKKVKVAKGKIRANLAVSTMRTRGKLPSSPNA